jgi:GST-like protein
MKLYHNIGWGSAIVEAQLAMLGLPFETVNSGDLFADAAALAAIKTVNPVGQVPVLVLDDGQVMTESAAITLYLSELAGSDLIVPPPGTPERPAFLRWLVFIVANIYPCFTFGDVPTRFVSDGEADAYSNRVTEQITNLWKVVAFAAKANGGPWFLGERFSAIDIYIAVMTNWRPGRATFEKEMPVLAEIAARATARPDMAAVMQRNFPKS